MIWRIAGVVVLLLLAAFVFRLVSFGSASRQMTGPKWAGGPLGGCPDRPNCVSSLATGEEHAVEPLAAGPGAEEAFQAAATAIAAMPRTRIVRREPDYLHAEARSALFGFVDDLELHLDREAGVLHVRSASRVGYSDLGANRRRVDALR